MYPDRFYDWGVPIVIFSAVASFAMLTAMTAPYGRHSRPGWGPIVRARFGWVMMELPSPVCFLLAYVGGDHAGEPYPLLFMAAYQLHYVHRTLVFPLLMRGDNKHNPVATIALAVTFNSVNGLLCGLAVSQYAHYGPDWARDPRFLLGALLFVTGFAINLHSDAILRGLRRPGESGYSVPHGGLFRWVSCPNYLGEIIEWCGWALATWSGAGLAFAIFTIANLAPRALSNQRWYRERFQDYPGERRALIPYFW
jgi:protein-S-isoprenylcysteine O-methyltransferase Ste14